MLNKEQGRRRIEIQRHAEDSFLPPAQPPPSGHSPISLLLPEKSRGRYETVGIHVSNVSLLTALPFSFLH